MEEVKLKEEQELWEPAEVENSESGLNSWSTESRGVQGQDETGASLTVKEEPEELKIPQKQNPFIRVIVKSEDEEEEPFFQETLDFENSSDTDDSGESSTAQTERLQEPDIVKNPHKCPVCGKVLQYSQNLKQHMLLHTGQRPYMCTVCGKDYTHVGHLRTHMRTHTGERPYSCSVCEKTFSVRDNLKSHMRTHTGEKPFRCSICDKSYTQNGNLQSHMRSHVGEKPFRCLICSKQFTQKYNLKKHVKRHMESPEGHHYKNDQEQTEEESDGTGRDWSETLTPTQPTLEDASDQNKETRFVCAFCDKTFSHRGNFNSHLLVHSEERPFSCSVCGKTFSRKSNLMSHMLVHSEEKPFSCAVCEKTFSRPGDLKKHALTHSQSTYGCSECGKTFAKQLLYKRHMLVHSERPFSCEVCDKKFLREVNLDKHMSTHAGEKPYSCPDCDRTFFKQCHLSKHMSRHKGDRPVGSNSPLIQPKPAQIHLNQAVQDPAPRPVKADFINNSLPNDK